jgi:chromosome segregation ATPase
MLDCEYDLWSKEFIDGKWNKIQEMRSSWTELGYHKREYTDQAPTSDYLEWRNSFTMSLPINNKPRLPQQMKEAQDYADDRLMDKEKLIKELQEENQKLAERQSDIYYLEAEVEMLKSENNRLQQEQQSKESENERLKKRSRTCEDEKRIAKQESEKAGRDLAVYKAQLQEYEDLLAQYQAQAEEAEKEIHVLRSKVKNRENAMERLENELVQLQQEFDLTRSEEKERFDHLHRKYEQFRNRHISCEESIQWISQKLKEQIRNYNEANERIEHIRTEGILLFDIIENASRRIHNLMTFYPGIPIYIAEELKAVRALLAPYVAELRGFNNKDK